MKVAEEANTVPVPKKESLRDGYRNDIDGLRAIAVMTVVLYHAGVMALSGGFVGVDVFFVISGYLIGAHIYREVVEGRFSLASFYQKRAKRILPALFGVLLFCYVMAAMVLPSVQLALFARFAVSSVFSFSNVLAWHRAVSYFDPGVTQNPLIMTWTLAVEEQFYIVFPLIMIILVRVERARRHGPQQLRRWVFSSVLVLGLLSFAACVAAMSGNRTAAFYLIPFRAWELAAGVLMAVYEAASQSFTESRPLYGGTRWANLRSVTGMGLILFAAVTYGPATSFPGLHAMAPVIGAVFVLSGPEAWMNRNVLSSGPFRWIGLISYSLYLWHWPLLSFANIVSDKPISVHIGLCVVAVGLAFAWASWRFIEQPFRRSKRACAPLLLRYAIACILLALPGVLMIKKEGFPGRFPAIAAIESDASPERNEVCLSYDNVLQTPQCLPKSDGRPTIALLGDSHAAALSMQMNLMAEAKGMRLVTLAHVSCPPLLGVTHDTVDGGLDLSCTRFTEAAVKIVSNDPTIHTVVLAGFWATPAAYKKAADITSNHVNGVNKDDSEEDLEEGLDSTITTLKAAGKRIIILQDVPTMRFSPSRRIETDLIPARRWLARHLLFAQGSNTGIAMPDETFDAQDEWGAGVVSRVAAKEGVTVFDMRVPLCREDGCLYFEKGRLLYQDTQHVTRFGAAIALQGLPLIATMPAR